MEDDDNVHYYDNIYYKKFLADYGGENDVNEENHLVLPQLGRHASPNLITHH